MDEALGIAGRLALLAGVSAAVLFLLGIVLKPVLPAGLPSGPAGRLLFAMLVAMSVGVATLAAGVMLERQRWDLLGLGLGGLHPATLLTSLGLGIVAIGIPAVLLLQTGAATLTPVTSTTGLMAYAGEVTLPILVLTLRDELLFRGYFHGLLSDRWGGLVAIGVTAVASTFWTAGNPMVDPASWIGVLALGVFLGTVRECSGGVVASWLAAIGFAWLQVAVLHVPAGGVAVGHAPYFGWTTLGTAWWSGGAAGVGVAPVTAATLLVVSFLAFRTRRRTHRSARD